MVPWLAFKGVPSFLIEHFMEHCGWEKEGHVHLCRLSSEDKLSSVHLLSGLDDMMVQMLLLIFYLFYLCSNQNCFLFLFIGSLPEKKGGDFAGGQSKTLVHCLKDGDVQQFLPLSWGMKVSLAWMVYF